MPTEHEHRSAAIPPKPQPSLVPAVGKAIAIIRRLNAGPSLGVSLAEISGDLGITRSHCHNILKTLVGEGWVTFHAGRRLYALAPRMTMDISRLVARHDTSSLIHDELVKLSLRAGVPCVLTRVEPDGSFVAVDKAEEAAELLVSVPIGHRFPADAPAQMRARLAFGSAANASRALEDWQPVAYAAGTLTDKDRVAEELEATRRRGYSVSHEEYTPGVTSLAAPIFDAAGDVQMILQCPGLTAAVQRREAAIASALLATTGTINRIFCQP